MYGIKNIGPSLVLVFCFLRSFEVLVIGRPIAYAQYFIASASLWYFLSAYLDKSIKIIRFEFILALVVFFLMTAAVFFQTVLGGDSTDIFGRTAHSTLRQVYFVCVAWFFAGAAFKYFPVEVRSGYVLLVAAAIFLMVIYATNLGFSVPYADIEGLGGFEVINHLMLSEYMLIILFWAYFFSDGRVKLIIFLIFLYAMFSGGGRSSFIIGMASLFVYELIFGLRKVVVYVAAVLGLLFSLMLFFIGIDDSVISYMLFSGGIENDNSYIGRLDQFNAGIDALWSQFLYGDVNFLVREFKHLGFYMHNIMSVWQFFGFFAFIGVLALIIISWQKIKFKYFFGASSVDKFFIGMFIYSVISIFTVKYVGFAAFWFSIGYWIVVEIKGGFYVRQPKS